MMTPSFYSARLHLGLVVVIAMGSIVMGSIVMGSIVMGSIGCGTEPAVDVVEVELALALDFESADVLRVAVYDVALVDCATLVASGAGDVDAEDAKVASGAALNGTGAATLEFDDLPAEKPLAFHGTVSRSGSVLAADCADATIPTDGHVDVVLVVTE